VKVGRLQIFNNWSPYMTADIDKVWVGMEYFVNEGDEMWIQSDSDISNFAVDELEKIGVVDPADVLDTTVIRVQKAYPAYFGTYNELHVVRDFTDQFENLFLIGRNGMHRYNNMDHSMLAAMAAVENIKNGIKSKTNLWAVNVEEEYHESKNS
jgi:protoporphyrinogen oxidase